MVLEDFHNKKKYLHKRKCCESLKPLKTSTLFVSNDTLYMKHTFAIIAEEYLPALKINCPKYTCKMKVIDRKKYYLNAAIYLNVANC